MLIAQHDRARPLSAGLIAKTTHALATLSLQLVPALRGYAICRLIAAAHA